MIPQGPQASVLEDTIEYELPFGTIGWLVGSPFVQRKLKRLFAFRHAVTRQAFECQPGRPAID
jgi:ligand-binding SRPBCC domain-containing protein